MLVETELEIGDIAVQVVKRKRMRNMNLTVHPPEGRVRVSAPLRASLKAIRRFVMSNMAWVKQRQKRVQSEPRKPAYGYVEGETHFVWGDPCRLEVAEGTGKPSVELDGCIMKLRVRPGTSSLKRMNVVNEWYRNLIRQAAPLLIEKWEPILGVKVARLSVRRMKTLWGSCTCRDRSIRISSELAKRPNECLDYIVLHEMVHLLERGHNARFKALLGQFMPDWKQRQKDLNALQVGPTAPLREGQLSFWSPITNGPN